MDFDNQLVHGQSQVIKFDNSLTLSCCIVFQGQMIMQDRLEKERCDAKNAVEEYVYDMRDKLCGPLEEFSKEVVNLYFFSYSTLKY